MVMDRDQNEETAPDGERVLAAWRAVTRLPFTGVLPRSRVELMTVIEEPLIPAVVELYDRNIQTLSSSCNVTDYYNGHA